MPADALYMRHTYTGIFILPDLARLGAPVTVALPENLAVAGVDDAQ